MGMTIHLVLGLALGAAAARLMRARHLRFSWAAACLGLVVLARGPLAGSAPTVAVAALTATVLGRRWQREDLEAGGDLARIAARRRGPVHLLGVLGAAAALARRKARGGDGWLRRGELILGRDESARTVSIPFAGADGGKHALVVGATGSGKTVTQTWMAVRAIDQGMGVIVVDPKGDHGLREAISGAAHAAGREFIDWTPGGPWVYNPYARGSESEIADKALAGERFTEPHYLRQAQRYLGHAVRAMRSAGLEVSLQGIVSYLDPAHLECLARSLPESEARSAHAYLDSLTHRQQSELAGVRDRLAILAESDLGKWLDPRTAGVPRFDLFEAARTRAIVHFSLQSDSRPLLTQMLGAVIVQDLQATVAATQGRPLPTLVVIDEFSAVAAEQVARLFGRARSAGFSLLVGAQELSDLRLPGRERLLEQVMGNLSVLIAHRQVVPDSARLIASLAGTTGAWRSSRHSHGGVTRTRTRESRLEADEVMSLGRGWAAVIVLAGAGSARIARIFADARGL
jgi:type IV secretory pathway TraG/TraD family ATPase VirD4